MFRNVKRQLNNVAKSYTDKNFYKQLITGANQLPFAFREFLKKIGNNKITRLQIVRSPISSILNSILNKLSGNLLKKRLQEMHYDSIFHLKLRINNAYDLEKEESPKLNTAVIKKDEQVMEINFQGDITINDFINNCINYMGIKKFITYRSLTNNCQDFVLALLHSNGINQEEYNNFIKQDAVTIFSGMPKWREKLMNTVTDIGNRLNMVVQGGNVDKDKYKGVKVVDIEDSDRKTKRFKAILSNGKEIHFGDKNGSTYIDNGDRERRINYIKRHSQNPKQKYFLQNMILSPSVLSMYILWGLTEDIYQNVHILNELLP